MCVNPRWLPILVATAVFTSGADGGEDPPSLSFTVRSDLAVDRGPVLVSCKIPLPTRTFTLRTADGKAIFAHFDRKSGILAFQDTFAAKATNSYTVHLGTAPKASSRPRWKKKVTTRSPRIRLGNRRVSGKRAVVNNGLLEVTVDRTERNKASVAISAVDSDYTIEVCPNGFATGCVDDPRYAREIERGLRQGKRFHPENFAFNFGIPEKIAVEQSSPLQMVIRVTCAPHGRKNSGEAVDLVSESTFQIELEWRSPVVVIRNHRKVAEKYYNHNGVFLNQFFTKQYPLELETDVDKRSVKVSPTPAGGSPPGLHMNELFILKEGAARTVVYQPDFRRLEVEGARLCLVADQEVTAGKTKIRFRGGLMTVISQSWGQGWKPVLQEAKDYDDRLVLVCDAGREETSGGEPKSLNRWLQELQNRGRGLTVTTKTAVDQGSGGWPGEATEAMIAAAFQGVQRVAVTEKAEPEIRAPTDVVVEVELAGLCGSDLHPYYGRERGLDLGTTMGHEMTGKVVAVGDAVASLRPGDSVVSPFSTSCGACGPCRRRLSARCTRGGPFGWVEDGVGLEGAQAEFVRVPFADTTLLRRPASISAVEALLLGDVVSTGFFAVNRAAVGPDTPLAVVGLGAVGLAAALAARQARAALVLGLDPLAERLELARSFGAVPLRTVCPDGTPLPTRDLRAEVRRHLGDEGAAVVVEAVGSPAAMRLAVELLRPGGFLSVAGMHTETAFALPPVTAYDKNVTFATGRTPVRSHLEELLRLQREARLPLERLVTHRVPLSAAPDAYRMFAERERGCVKVIFEP